MIFLLDENFPKAAAGVLEGMGHTVHDVRDIGLSGCDDTRIIHEASRLGAIILTTDRDFFHTLHHQHPDHHGIVVIALRQPSRSAILDRLKMFLGSIPTGGFAARSFQLRDNTWLAQPPLGTDD